MNIELKYGKNGILIEKQKIWLCLKILMSDQLKMLNRK
jgi:hypothetical protein